MVNIFTTMSGLTSSAPGRYEKQEFKNTLLSLDYQFNVLNAITGFRPGRRWDASLYLGPSLALGEQGTNWGWNFGGILSYQLTKNLSLFYSHTVYRMGKDRYKTAQVYRTPGTYVNSLSVGVLYNMNGSLRDALSSLACDYHHQPLTSNMQLDQRGLIISTCRRMLLWASQPTPILVGG